MGGGYNLLKCGEFLWGDGTELRRVFRRISTVSVDFSVEMRRPCWKCTSSIC